MTESSFASSADVSFSADDVAVPAPKPAKVKKPAKLGLSIRTSKKGTTVSYRGEKDFTFSFTPKQFARLFEANPHLMAELEHAILKDEENVHKRIGAAYADLQEAKKLVRESTSELKKAREESKRRYGLRLERLLYTE